MLNSVIPSLEASLRQSITNLSTYLSFGVGTDSHLLYHGQKVLSLFEFHFLCDKLWSGETVGPEDLQIIQIMNYRS